MAAVTGVVLVLILVALLVFCVRRQRNLKRKETMRRILQEHEVGTRVHSCTAVCLCSVSTLINVLEGFSCPKYEKM